jgi:hypothetical protein
MTTLKARKGDPINCKNGHQVGSFIQDVPEDRGVTSADLSFSDKGLMSPVHGYECPVCGEPVALFSDTNSAWKVFATSGWIS